MPVKCSRRCTELAMVIAAQKPISAVKILREIFVEEWLGSETEVAKRTSVLAGEGQEVT